MTDDARFPRTVLAACCVPWDQAGQLADHVFRDSIAGLVREGFGDLYVFGTAGEGHAVDEPRFDQVVDVFADEARRHGVEPMVGLISLSLPTVIDRIERCLIRGIRSFQLSLPSWGALNDVELASFFAETCGRFPNADFLHYNLARSGRMLTPDDYATLAARHPNLVAVKHTRADYPTVHRLFAQTPSIRHFFTESTYSYASLVGPAGFLVSVASVNPRRAREFFDAGVARDVAALMAMCAELVGMSGELRRAVGPGPHIDGAFDKVFAKVHDPEFPLRLLPPYQGSTDEAYKSFLEALNEHYPQWVRRRDSDHPRALRSTC
ncbi:dihydrodipicolinate synthase family protein [Jiangella gansuensis]|uniref:dihydrodipicolinate synthase family protein n=1 Tax=Jiangella gansuensis TaxID=281473 RepID=UPI000478871B|nr:dihydrodipicolinate synthase family protein [Jiangella gansuensis]